DGEELRELLHRAVTACPDDPETANYAAWLMVRDADPRFEVKPALDLAQRATRKAPGAWHIWNTLGVACYRAGDWRGALGALRKSEELDQGRNLGANAFALALTHWQLGNQDQARGWYDRGVQWMINKKLKDEELDRL